MKQKRMKRNLNSRHVSMMAIGGSIGTGLFMATGAMFSQAGSYLSVASYIFIGVFIYLLMSAVGELASFYPVSGSFSSYAERFVDPSLGFALGWLYCIMWILVAGIDIITLAKVLQFWSFFQQFSIMSLCLFFLLVLCIINIASVKFFGEVEYWLTTIKVLAVIFFLLAGVGLILGVLGGTTHSLNTFVNNSKSAELQGFLGFFAILSTAAFSFGGTESVAVASGESKNPEKTMSKAVNKVFWRILIFYVATIFIIAAVIPITDPRLLDTSNISASPFTLVFENAGFLLAASVMNAVICASVLSAANSGIYFSSRQLFSLGTRGLAPKMFSKLSTNSSPQSAVLLCIIFIVLTFLFEKYNATGYYMLLSLVGLIIVCVWIIAIFSQIRLRKAIIKQNKNIEDILPYRAKFGIVGSYVALIAFILLIVLQTYSDFVAKGVLAGIYDLLPIIFILALYFGYKLITKSKIVKIEDIDLQKSLEE
ncbi:amino acid permease [Gemella sp. GH3]|uniref:amino acid permease n=1 Tax=unclassified Gemella TaxID=2624949 RepID=UPI0015D0038F|nr:MULTISPECIES: amino acid permease [unclassified Gemella]MBF0713775.1 amino acid permease [Gemella sp. GH3.1]NYS50727.1 amino acid permease [Gemella sp. GH3]